MNKQLLLLLFLAASSTCFATQSPLLSAASANDFKQIIELLDTEPLLNVNEQVPAWLDHGGNTALHFVAKQIKMSGAQAAYNALLVAKANTSIKNKEGLTAPEIIFQIRS